MLWLVTILLGALTAIPATKAAILLALFNSQFRRGGVPESLEREFLFWSVLAALLAFGTAAMGFQILIRRLRRAEPAAHPRKH